MMDAQRGEKSPSQKKNKEEKTRKKREHLETIEDNYTIGGMLHGIEERGGKERKGQKGS